MSRRFSLLASLYQFIRIPITGISVSTNGSTVSSSGTLEKGKTRQLYSIISPSNTTDSKEVKWSCSDNSIATVNMTSGLVTAKSNGSCKITVTLSENPNIVAFYSLTVYTSSSGSESGSGSGSNSGSNSGTNTDPDPDSSTTTSSTPSPEDTTTTSSNPPTGSDFSATFKTSDGQTVKCEDYGTIVLFSVPASVITAYESTGGTYTYNTLSQEYTYVFRDKLGGEHKYFVQIQSYT